MSRISVIIPNYNRATLIGATIDNMLSQTLPPDEVIVVDDGSTDNSVEVIRSFGDRVQLIEQSNQGPGAARNRGLEVASGEYIQFMDSDDLASLNKLEVQLAALQRAGADFAYCPWIRSVIDGRQIRFSGPVLQGSALLSWKPMLEWQLGAWCLVFQNCLFRRRILDKAGKYRIDLMPTEDSEYLVRLLLAGAMPIYTPDCLIFYRVEAEGQNQITSGGMRDENRAKDRSRYLEIVSGQVEGSLTNFHLSTIREIVLDVYRHNRYCQERGWPVVPIETAFGRLAASMPHLHLQIYDYWNRISRKITRISAQTPLSPGLAVRPINFQEKCLAFRTGLQIVGEQH